MRFDLQYFCMFSRCVMISRLSRLLLVLSPSMWLTTREPESFLRYLLLSYPEELLGDELMHFP